MKGNEEFRGVVRCCQAGGNWNYGKEGDNNGNIQEPRSVCMYVCVCVWGGGGGVEGTGDCDCVCLGCRREEWG